MLAKKLEKSLNDQVNEEFQAAYLYLAMSAHCEAENLPGFANWFRLQAQEEVAHGMRFYQFIVDRDGRVVLGAIKAPPLEYGDLPTLLQGALDHERKVTRSIYDLYRLAEQEQDYAAHSLLEDFASEQVEEEKSIMFILESLKRVGADGAGLFLLDKDLGTRGSASAADG